jgi:hypothetical protein
MKWDEIEDDSFYLIKPLGITVRGKTLNSPDARAFILAEIETEKRRAAFERACYPNPSNIQVYKEHDDPIIYTIYPSFDGIKGTVREFGLPDEPDTIYASILFNSGRFLKHGRANSKRRRNYVIEEFGLRIGPTIMPPTDPDQLPVVKAPPLPDPLRYKCQPRYWRLFGGSHLLQVWRTRVFFCAADSIQTTVAHPLSPEVPHEIYFEERWHPRRGRRRFMGGLENRSKLKGLDVNRCYREALRILTHERRKTGPIEEAGPEAFERRIKKAYSTLYGSESRRPSQEAVAQEMLISRKTLRKYLDLFGIDYPPHI